MVTLLDQAPLRSWYRSPSLHADGEGRRAASSASTPIGAMYVCDHTAQELWSLVAKEERTASGSRWARIAGNAPRVVMNVIDALNDPHDDLVASDYEMRSTLRLPIVTRATLSLLPPTRASGRSSAPSSVLRSGQSAVQVGGPRFEHGARGGPAARTTALSTSNDDEAGPLPLQRHRPRVQNARVFGEMQDNAEVVSRILWAYRLHPRVRQRRHAPVLHRT